MPLSSQNYTYVFIPQDFLQGLYGVVDLPSLLTEPDFHNVDANDTIPSNIDPSTISYVCEFLSVSLAFSVSKPCTTVGSLDSGKPVSFGSRFSDVVSKQDLSGVAGGQEWTAIDTVLIRLDTNYLNVNGPFPVYLNRTLPGSFAAQWNVVGYDAAVCVRRYEPWIVETYNTSTASPSALRIVGKGNASTPLPPSGNIQGPPIANTRYLNMTKLKDMLLSTAHGNTVGQMLLGAGSSGFYYAPSTVASLVMPPPTTFLLTSTYSTGIFFN